MATLLPSLAWASGGTSDGPRLAGIPLEFFLFAATLIGVALFHHHTLKVALTGLASVLIFKLGLTSFDIVGHMTHEWVVLVNLFGLLVGFSLLANHFEESGVPGVLPKFLPDDWKGGFVLLILVFFMSSFLDNIAAAMIGGTVAATVYKGRVHIAYLAGIIAASNGGGSGSVVGDTTTTMMWIDGVSPFDVIHAYAAAFPALFVSGIIASIIQQKHQPIVKDGIGDGKIDWGRVGVVAVLLLSAVLTNVLMNVQFPQYSDALPWLAIALWLAIGITSMVRHTDWGLVPDAAKGSVFLLSLVMCASMMPVSELPGASWYVAMGLGFVSAVFDNIPLTALALKQGGYDWGFLAFAVGYGGSMVWFGSSAGVALSNKFPEARNALLYLRHGWHVVLAYVIGFFIMYGTMGWHPHAPHKEAAPGHAAPAAEHAAPPAEGGH